MSLKFGIYLVEQRIITPEQFCGLVKIQQETMVSLANLAIQKNLLTIRQVATILDELEANPTKTFQQIAIEKDLLDEADAAQLVQYQLESCTSIRTLVAECGLLTERQASVLYHHFDRTPATATSHRPAAAAKPAPTANMPARGSEKTASPPRPKFRSRPVIVHPYSTTQ
jgi:hypothetical protein